MHKCNQCGTEFEGKFCPECGTRFPEEKTCPVCGKTLAANTKFCPECGHSFWENAAAQTPTTETPPYPAEPYAKPENRAQANNASGLKKAYGIFTFIPAILFAAFSVLLFLFFLGDVGSVSFLGFSESTDSLYAELGNDELGILPTLAALVAFAALSLIVSVLFLKTAFTADRAKRKKIGKFDVLLTTVYTYISFALFFVHFLVGCIAAGQVASEGLSAGASIICVIVFSLFFGLASAGFFIARALIGKKHPVWVDEENAKFKELAAKAEQLKAEETAVASADSQNVTAGNHLGAEKQMKVIRDVKAVVRRKTAVITFFVSFYIPIVGLIGMFAALGQKIWEWKPERVTKEKKSFIGLAIPSAVFCIGYTVLIALMLNGTIFGDEEPQLLKILFPSILGLAAIQLLAGFILAIASLPVVTRLQIAFYGKKNPSALLDQPILTMQELCLTEERRKNGEIKVKKSGSDKFFISVICVVLSAIVIAGSCIAAIVLGNKFQASKVAKIEMGDSKSEVESVLGKADEETDYGWTYYSNNYMSLAKEVENLEKETEEAILKGDFEKALKLESEALELEKKAEELTYQYISVTFDSEGKVTQVVFDNKCKANSESTQKYIEYDNDGKRKIILSNDKIPQFCSVSDLKVSAKIYYDDGSFKNVMVPASAFSKVKFDTIGNYRIEWADEWYSSYSAEVSVVTNHTNYKVTYVTNGGNEIQSTTGPVDTLPTPVREGYVFAGWYTTSDCSGNRISSPYYPVSNVTLYAKWLNENEAAITEENDKTNPFEISNGVYTSSNTDDSSSSTYTITAHKNITLSFRYTVSSESDYDTFKITVYRTDDSSEIIAEASGTNFEWTDKSVELNAGDRITFTYSKDGSSKGGDDCGKFDNLRYELR